MTTAEALLAQLDELLAHADEFGISEQTRVLLDAARAALSKPTDTADPLAYRAAVENVVAMMRAVFGAAATKRAEDLARRSPRPFPRMVRNELGRQDRDSSRDQINGDTAADPCKNGNGGHGE